jgi:hypothetical protein
MGIIKTRYDVVRLELYALTIPVFVEAVGITDYVEFLNNIDALSIMVLWSMFCVILFVPLFSLERREIQRKKDED